MSDKPESLRVLLNRYLCENLIDFDPKTKRKHEYVLDHYERIVRAKISELIAQKRLPAKSLPAEGLRVAHLKNRYAAWMMSELLREGLSRNTINGYRSKLVAVWAWACRQAWLKRWPSVRRLIVPERTPIAWSPDEVRAIWRGIDTLEGFVGGVAAPLWWRVYHGIMFDTAERHDARMMLEWKHFRSIAAGEGEFPAEIRKGKRKPMPFQLSAPTIADLLRLRLCGAEPWVLPWAFTPNHFWHKYRKVLQHCGVPYDRYHMTHCGRRFVGTQLWIRDKEQAVEGLGHDSAKTTRDCYVDPRFVERTWPHQIMPNLRPDLPEPPRAA